MLWCVGRNVLAAAFATPVTPSWACLFLVSRVIALS